MEETLEEAAEKHKQDITDAWSINEHCKSSFIEGAKWQQERSYSEENMIEASKYGYNFHKTTQFPQQEFEDSCIRNTQQWLTTFKKK